MSVFESTFNDTHREKLSPVQELNESKMSYMLSYPRHAQNNRGMSGAKVLRKRRRFLIDFSF